MVSELLLFYTQRENTYFCTFLYIFALLSTFRHFFIILITILYKSIPFIRFSMIFTRNARCSLCIVFIRCAGKTLVSINNIKSLKNSKRATIINRGGIFRLLSETKGKLTKFLLSFLKKTKKRKVEKLSFLF